MVDLIVSHLGQVNQAGDDRALFLKMYSGEVLTAFMTSTMLKDKQRRKTITSGKSYQFPATFKTSAKYHTPGQQILGGKVRHNEVLVTIDNYLISPLFLDEWEEAVNHYDVRAPYSEAQGETMALAYDRGVSRNIILAARGGELFPGDGGGAVLTNANFANDGQTLADAMFTARQTLEEKDVTGTPYAMFQPAQWYLMAQTEKVLDKDFGSGGNYAAGSFVGVAGLQILRSNALPFGQDETSGVDAFNVDPEDGSDVTLPAKYAGDWTNTKGIVWTADAVATLELRGMSMQYIPKPDHIGDLMLAKQAVGHGTLRNKCAIELAIA